MMLFRKNFFIVVIWKIKFYMKVLIFNSFLLLFKTTEMKEKIKASLYLFTL